MDMDLVGLSKKIRECDMNTPFAFVSYCSKDSIVVWNDIYHLQREGYNIWIDTNLKETEESWKDSAFGAIKDINCKLFIFYNSKSSIVSKPCLEELRCKCSEDARKQHGGKEISWIVIDVENIGKMQQMREKVFDDIVRDSSLPHDKKNQMATTLSDLMDEFFPTEDKIRIKSKDDPSRRYDYYQKIEENLVANGITKSSYEEMYIKSIRLLKSPISYGASLDIIDYCATEKNYLPAILMSAFIYYTGICGICDKDKAKDQLDWATYQKEKSEWQSLACKLRAQNKYEEAIAYYSAIAISDNSSEAYLEASKMWMKMKNNASFEFTKKCAEEAEKLNNQKGIELYTGLKKMSREMFIEFTRQI